MGYRRGFGPDLKIGKLQAVNDAIIEERKTNLINDTGKARTSKVKIIRRLLSFESFLANSWRLGWKVRHIILIRIVTTMSSQTFFESNVFGPQFPKFVRLLNGSIIAAITNDEMTIFGLATSTTRRARLGPIAL